MSTGEARPVAANALSGLRRRLRELYFGRSRGAVRFQVAVIALDFAIVAFFIAAPILRDTDAFLWVDYGVAALLAADLVARSLGATSLKRVLRSLTFWVDAFILVTLLTPHALANLGFLRVMRLWSLSQSGFLWRFVNPRWADRWREAGHTVITMVTFLFVITGFVYTFFFRADAGLSGYVDALYFTVATITTTGFGDITLPGTAGKLTSIVTMILGISLFVRLAQALFRPTKVNFACPRCALQRHDVDAVHCKACGCILAIPDNDD